MPYDRFARNIHYLRVSLTDHCNLRCVYCMPAQMTFRPNPELMQDDELLRLVNLFARLGVDKIRLTGGEPTLRPRLPQLTAAIAAIPGIRWLSMTTNAVRLAQLAEPLKAAGLQRVNISLDTLDPQRFHAITRWGRLEEVWAGIQAAEQVGLTPIKLNAVMVRGFNDQDLLPLARLTLAHAWQVRFIEMMPFAGATDLQRGQVISAAAMIAELEAEFGPLQDPAAGRLDGEARILRIPGAPGELGFISSVSHPFCADCTRARLTADGKLRLCLLREKEVDLLTPLRQGADDESLRALILEGVWQKPWGHGLAQGEFAVNRGMSEIGG
jgi:cyclic pyranopterin phosphate synthase